MNRETQAHFAQIPSMDISRSKFDRSFIHKTTCNAAELVPIYVDPDIVPGDTVTMRMSDLIRMTTPITPVMDELKADFYFFFVPNRLVWDNFKKFMGENDTAPWIQQSEYQIPQIRIQNRTTALNKLECTVQKGSVLDHMGIPTNNKWKIYKETVTDPDTQETTNREIQITALPPRAYTLIWNEFFRSEALQNPCNIPKTDNNVPLENTNANGYIANPESFTTSYEYRGGLPCLKVCKTFDYFTAALPAPQAGPGVEIPVSMSKVPVDIGQGWYQDPISGDWGRADVTNTGATFAFTAEGGDPIPDATMHAGYAVNDGTAPPNPLATTGYTGLQVDLSNASWATINELRTAFAIQKWEEREARGGQRYIEMVRSHFNVVNPDFRLQRPEYLGGFTHNININQVIQTNETSENSPLGATGAYSLTTDKNGDVFSHSFTEHGILMGLMCIRQVSHTYQQGINRAWLKKERFDFYTPEFANLGETYIKQMEIYADGTDQDNDAFGYQERWAEMRYLPDIVSGEMRSDYSLSEDIWHYADYYEESPKLGSKWIQETDANILRTLAVQDQDQFKIDLYFGAQYTRPLPVFSVPGLLDHH